MAEQALEIGRTPGSRGARPTGLRELRGDVAEVHERRAQGWREYRGEAWERLTNRPQEFRDLGESVLMLGQMDFTARTTGIEFSQELGELMEFRAGKIVRVRDFLTHAEALEAAGLSE